MNAILCRLCLKDCSRPFYEIEEDCAFLKQIFLCFSYQLALNANMPKQICEDCINKLHDIQSFRQMIINNEKILQNKIILNHNEDPENCSYVDVKEKNIWDNDVKLNNIVYKDNKINVKLENAESCDDFVCSNENSSSIKEDTHSITSIKEESITAVEEGLDNELIKHTENVQTLSEIAPNTCLMCLEKFSTKMLLLKHYISVENKQYVELSSQIDVDEMSYTKIINDNTMYVCKKCDRECKTRKMMVNHLLTHNKEWPFSCKLCGKMHITAYDMIKHGKSHSFKSFTCSFQCGFSSGYAHIVKNHERGHGMKYKYTCNECGKHFQVKTWFEQHQNIHKGLRQYVCSICGASFHMDKYLTRHKNSVHLEETSNKRYICVHCSRICNSKRSLNLHLREHGVKTEYLCDVCGKVMCNPEQLKLHRRIHDNERPYACGICNKSFTKNYNLKLHQAVHTQDRLACTICMKTFTQRSSLNRHKSRKHGTDVNEEK